MSKATFTTGLSPSIAAVLRTVLLAWLAILSGPEFSWSDEPAKKLSPEAIARYVADLDNDSRAVRAAAESALVTAGPAVLDDLPLAGSHPDPVVRESLDRVIRAIETNEFRLVLKPRSVQLAEVHNLREAVQRIGEVTGNRIALTERPPATAPLMFSTMPLTFWEAISTIEKQSQLQYHSGSLAPATASSTILPSSVSGPFRSELLHCEQRTTTGGERLLSVKIRLTCEPRLRPLFLVAAVDEWSASCELATASPFTPMARREIQSTSTGEIDVAFDFVVPPTINDQQSWTITGDVDLTLAAQSTSVTFSDLTVKLPLTRRRGQASLSLLEVMSKDTTCSVRLATAFPHLTGLFESYRASLLAPVVLLETPDGDRHAPVETVQFQEAPQGLILEYRFDQKLVPGSRVTATIPAAISTQKIPFRFDKVTPAKPAD